MTKATNKSLDLKRRLSEATTDEERQTILDGLPHDVGFAKPPKSTQFQPGKSGNPQGRPKGSPNLGKVLMAELDQLIEVNDNGRRRKLPKGQIAVRQIVNKAVTGDVKAFSVATDLLRKIGLFDDVAPPKEEVFDARDLQAADNLLGFFKPDQSDIEGGAQ
jgi:hypothetical protein